MFRMYKDPFNFFNLNDTFFFYAIQSPHKRLLKQENQEE